MKVKCIKLVDGYGDPVVESTRLVVGKVYVALALEFAPGRPARIRLAESDETTPSLWVLDAFHVLDSPVPADWLSSTDDNGTVRIGYRMFVDSDFMLRLIEYEPDAVNEYRVKLLEVTTENAQGTRSAA
jgi:hypothetical protein